MAVKRININKLRMGMRLASPVYEERDNKRILMLPANTLITNELQLSRVINSNLNTVEIDTETGGDTFLSLGNQKKWEDVVSSAKNKDATKAIITRHINTFSSSITNIASQNIASKMLIREEEISSLIKDIILFVENHVDLLLGMIRLKGVAEYAFSHVINTMILSISVAHSFKLDYADIKRFGIAALITDLGMANFPSSMIQRSSGLSKKEIEEVKKHPVYSRDFLKKIGVNDSLIEMVVMQHHERFDGSGYPEGLKGNEIHSLSKLLSIVDVYVAMTTPRPHRSGLPPHTAISDILKKSMTQFDLRIAKVFIKHIGVFPVGSLVELASGHVALVAGQNKSDQTRPLVIVLQTKKKVASFSKMKSKGPNVVITRGKWDLIDLALDKGTYGKVIRGLDHREYHVNPAYYLNQI
ncbi:MAG: HD domain-containing protein [Candidatus Latescibacteria bacterium]|jgi:HD-GYP domain-containing protein (c-di-GMP phosphodiesterase class II)|nr:HD domain-containing protein [Candidatus Latescibacterota bacterium]